MEIETWALKRRNYLLEWRRAAVEKVDTGDNPLIRADFGEQNFDFDDPLSGKITKLQEQQNFYNLDTPEEYWNQLKRHIMRTYFSRGAIQINNSQNPGQKDEKVSANKSKLAQYKQIKSDQDFTYVNTNELATHLELMIKEMHMAWVDGDRVKALKIAIQSSKMLRDLRQEEFFPSVFILISELISQFGELVYQRLKSMGFDGKSVSDTFLPSQVNRQAKDTANNWFMKISCIRELQPRTYIEISLLKCYKFLWLDNYSDYFQRIVEQIRGIGNPIMACYCGMFLTRKVNEIQQSEKGYLKLLIREMMETTYDLDQNQYESVRPALQWVTYCLAYNSDQQELLQILENLTKLLMKKQDFLILLLEQFDSSIVISNLPQIMTIVEQFTNESDIIMLHSQIAKSISSAAQINDKYEWLNTLWSPVSQSKKNNLKLYLKSSLNFIQLVQTHFGQREINLLMKDIMEHIEQDLDANLSDEISNLMLKLITSTNDINSLLGLEGFLPLLEQLNISKKTEICKKVIESFGKSSVSQGISNPMMIHALFAVTRVVHDSVDLNHNSSEFISQSSNLICSFLCQLNLGRDLEQHLQILTEARASFINLEIVTITLVEQVLKICMLAHKFVQGRHNQRTLGFLKACVSYAHITIPGIDSSSTQFRLFYQSAQVALVNGLIGEAEALVKAAIALIPEMAEHLELDEAENLLISMIGFMTNLPDNPASTNGFFIPVHGILNAVSELNDRYFQLRVRVYYSLMCYLLAQQQDNLPIRIFRVDSNDKLMAGNDEFFNEMKDLLVRIIEEILSIVQIIQQKPQLTEFQIDFIEKVVLAIRSNYQIVEGNQVIRLLNRLLSIYNEKASKPNMSAILDKLINN